MVWRSTRPTLKHLSVGLVKLRSALKHGKGAGAEGVVGNQLSALGTEYKIISDFQTGRGNIDFIVVGPKGIFTIEVKADKGVISYQNETLLVNGKTTIKNYVRQTMAESLFLSDLLYKKFGRKYFVTGILEFPYGKIDTNSIHGKIDEIWIGGAYFHEYAINKSLNILSKITGINPLLDHKRINFMTKNQAGSIEKAKRELGYKPKISSKEGLRRTIEHFRKTGFLK